MPANSQLELERKELEKRLADLKARLPAHSVPTSMMIELDELEDQLDVVRAKIRKQE